MENTRNRRQQGFTIDVKRNDRQRRFAYMNVLAGDRQLKIKRMLNSNNLKVVAIDLFCGAGGLTHGLLKAGISVSAGIDVDPACKYPFEKNNRATFIKEDVSDVKGSDLEVHYPQESIRLLVGCAPCQPFSRYSRKKEQSKQKWGLLKHFSRLVEEVRPAILSMENVPGLTGTSVFRGFTRKLEKMGYIVSHSNVFCPDYGIPQQRSRLVLFASTKGKVELIPPTHTPNEYITVGHVLRRLNPVASGQVDPSDPLHRACNLSSLNLERLRASKPGGYWRDWPSELIADCHRAETGKTYPSVYGRMEWDKPSPTITTQFFGFGNGRFGHPEQDRAISLREGSILQSFPKSYKFCPGSEEPKFAVLGRLIGNAVPVRLGEVIGISLLNHLKAYNA